ncbi:putative cysteine protease YraA [Ptychodera flava]|uniref:putative cysteine protease YraA n=1 Tax=Ptychodera flava TaxID=63121 RepID=UPI00396A6504
MAAPIKKKVGILVEFNYEELEVWYPLLRFREEGMETVTIGPQKDKVYNSKHGYPCKADVDIENISPAELDALVIPGGWAPDYWRRDRRFVDLVRCMFEAEKPVAAICHGPWLLVSANVLSVFASLLKDDVINAGADYQDAPVVVDGNLITSRVPADLPEFCKALLTQLHFS